jgi:hypothetical protein|tara:strand:+ start:1221 stop:1364 length:144 start_codon:yes stop_codon:yes gene_type:complete
MKKELRNDCLMLANMEYEKLRSQSKSEVQERALKAWTHIMYLIETAN